MNILCMERPSERTCILPVDVRRPLCATASGEASKGVTDPGEEAQDDRRRVHRGALRSSSRRDGEQRTGVRPTFLVQGTLYPDVIESCPPPGKRPEALAHDQERTTTSAGYPKELGFELVEPLRMLFKDEVRKLGADHGRPAADSSLASPVPGSRVSRVRVLGDVSADGALETILRAVDEVYINAIQRRSGLYDQDLASVRGVPPRCESVGVQGDQRIALPRRRRCARSPRATA